MCQSCCLSRRAVAAGLASLALAPPARAASCAADGSALVEPAISLRLPPDAPRTLALTLDACSGETDQRILDTLIALSIPATIFASGLWLPRNAAALATLRAHPDLFTIENHGERHLPPVLGTRRIFGLTPAGTPAAIAREVATGADLIERATGTRPRWYRAATGLYSPAALPIITDLGVAIAGYSLNADQGAALPAAAVARRLAAARSGDIIVAHLNQPHRASGAGVAAGLAALHEAGVSFVRLDALPTTAPACTPRTRTEPT